MDLDFKDEIWATVSEDCIDLLKQMLCKEIEERYDIADVLLHPWVVKILQDAQ